MGYELQRINNATAVSLLAQLLKKDLLPVTTGFDETDVGYQSTNVAPGNVFNHVVPSAATRAALASAISSLGVTKGTVHVLASTAIDDDLTSPANVTLRCEPGAVLTVSSGKTLTINGPFEAPAAGVFAGAGSVAFGSASVPEVSPAWWGASPSASGTVNRVAIQAAINAIATTGGHVLLLPGHYDIDGHLHIRTSGIRLAGTGTGRTTVVTLHNTDTSGGHAIIVNPNTTATDDTTYRGALHLHGVEIERLKISGAVGGGDGVHSFNAAVELRHVNITANGRDGLNIKLGWSSTFEDVTFSVNGRNGVCSDNSLNAAAFRSCNFLGHHSGCGAHIIGGAAIPDPDGGQAAGTNSIEFSACDFEGNGVGAYFDTDTYAISDVTFLNTNFEGNDTLGIQQVGSGNFYGVRLLGGTFATGNNGVDLAKPLACSSQGICYAATGTFAIHGGEFVHFAPRLQVGTIEGAIITSRLSVDGGVTIPDGSLYLGAEGAPSHIKQRINGAWVELKNASIKEITVTKAGAASQAIDLDDAHHYLLNLYGTGAGAPMTSLTLTASGGTYRAAGAEIEIRFLNVEHTTAMGAITWPANFLTQQDLVLPDAGTSCTIRFKLDGNGNWWETGRSWNDHSLNTSGTAPFPLRIGVDGALAGVENWATEVYDVTAAGAASQELDLSKGTRFVLNLEGTGAGTPMTSLTISETNHTGFGVGAEIQVRILISDDATPGSAITWPANFYLHSAVVFPASYKWVTLRFQMDGNGNWWEVSRNP